MEDRFDPPSCLVFKADAGDYSLSLCCSQKIPNIGEDLSSANAHAN